MDNDIKKEIGNKIRQLRTVRGWSRGQMADNLKMSESNYGNIERGEADIKITLLVEIAEIFEITLYDLLGLNEKTVFNFTKTKTTVNTVGINPTSNNVSDINLLHELEKKVLELKSANNEIENLKVQIAQLQEINALLKAKTGD
jgi:transcriptional regulator with XRE-family HTH domain